MTYIKENIITKLQKLYSQPRNLRAGNKSPAPIIETSQMNNLKIFVKLFLIKSNTCEEGGYTSEFLSGIY